MQYQKRTNITPERQDVIFLANTFEIPEKIAEVLISRGYDTNEDIYKFLNPKWDGMHDPYLFRDMEKAVSIIKELINNKEKIVIWGDFDCDGVCSTSILALEINRLGGNVSCYIPDRHKEGYGLNKSGIKKLKEEKNPSLIITVDCGISAKNEIEYAYSNNIKVIVTDHHEPPEKLPECEAILDAKVFGETYPFKELCGAGVVGKICEALSGRDILKKYIDLIAMATIADIVPLVDENRVFSAAGIAMMKKHKRPGIAGLCKYAGDEINSYTIGFRFAPMVNACGRLGHASDCVNLFTTNNEIKIRELCSKLNAYNNTRKEKENELVEKCFSMIDKEKKHKAIVVWGDDWEIGVIGIVASRIVEVFHCPTIVLSYNKETDTYKGSGRSVSGINLYESLKKCEEFLTQFGGHSMAAGLSVSGKDIELFEKKFKDVMDVVDDSFFEDTRKYDTDIPVSAVTTNFAEALKMFEPTGCGNAKPLFLMKNVSFKEIVERGKDGSHFSCVVYDEHATKKAIAFNQKRPCSPEDLDILCSAVIDEYKGVQSPRVQIVSFKDSKEKTRREIFNSSTLYGIRMVPQPLATLNITQAKIKQFEKVGIYTVTDLLNYFPKKYIDFRETKLVRETQNGEVCSIVGKITAVRQSEKMVYLMCTDKEGTTFMPCWFNQGYLYNRFYEGQRYNFCGQVKKSDGGFTQIYPTYFDKDIEKLKALIPVYKKIPGMSTEYLSNTIEKALKYLTNTDYLEESIVKDFDILSEYDTYMAIHRPKSDIDITLGQKRKVFDSLFKFNFILKDKLNVNDEKSIYTVKTRNIWDEFKKIIPYTLTKDQDDAINKMYEYMASGNILNGITTGDVGTGKSIVAFFMLALSFENWFQSCIMAPTEVLAKQHFDELSIYAKKLGFNVAYLTGSTKQRDKKKILDGLSNGEIDVVVGTHAVIQDCVSFKNLGFVVIDEQHRFGVLQREMFLQASHKPHILTMSATPIPRTLSMALYGDDIQIFEIHTMPEGRKPVITLQMETDEEINEFMLSEIKKGRQCYVVCPIIEESDSERMANVRSVKETADEIKEYFALNKDVKISDISGRMKQALINDEIDKFTRNETNILISTTIIEVGVNIPNASVMVIKSSERFGLAQVHQLRGRVGRSCWQSYCILQTDTEDRKAQILCGTTNGFDIAKQDMMMRGPGDFIGVKQSGDNKNVMLMLSEPELYDKISKLNDNIYKDSARFARYQYMLEDTEGQED